MPVTLSGTSCTFVNVEETSATDPPPLFGTPVVSGNQLLFSPTSFSSYSAGPGADITDSHLTMTITAASTMGITSVLLSEMGDYTLFGIPGATGNASVSTPVTMLINNDSDLTLSAYMTFTSMPVGSGAYSPHSGTFVLPDDAGTGVLWQGTLDADIPAFLASKGYSGPATQIYLSLDDVLGTWATAGAEAEMEKKLFSVSVGVDPVPEPSTFALLGVGAIALIGWGMRRSKQPA
jgi:hypothetical protein